MTLAWRRCWIGSWIAIWLGASAALSWAQQPHYVGELMDGKKISGSELRDAEGAPANWKLDGTELFSQANPLRWLRNNELSAPPRLDTYIEFRNGDILPAEVSQYEAGTKADPQFADPRLIATLPNGIEIPETAGRTEGEHYIAPLSFRTVRVDPGQIKKIVWKRRGNESFTPNTVYYRDGRTATFRSVRWEDAGIKILTEKGADSIPFGQIAELHLSTVDYWQEYARQLAILMPELHGRIVQFVTTDGGRITGNADHFQMPALYPPVAKRGDKRTTRYRMQLVQPIWSRDAIWLDMTKIRIRRYFSPHEIALTWLTPSAIQQSTGLARSWLPQADANVQNGPLIAGNAAFGWGWGVHAFNQLEFTLPSAAQTFRTEVGLDRAASAGGCAKGVVFLNAVNDKPLFSSPVFVGPKDVADSGRIELPDLHKPDRKLILLADPVLKNVPANADPLEIGDMLDWLEPIMTLEPSWVRSEVSKQVTALNSTRKLRKDREQLRQALAKIAPGFEPAQTELRFRSERAKDGEGLELMPQVQFFPHILRAVVEIPANKITKLRVVGTRGSLAWHMLVLANGIQVSDQMFDMEKDHWDPREVDLTQFAGRRVALEICDYEPQLTQGHARISKIELVSTDPPKPPEEKKPDEKKPDDKKPDEKKPADKK
ncbi:MAG TPA: NPCBM/NEW2 domain-containing protein [Pirellulales bacterium]|jgi:hypothetical protein|nr:NPCBM/NEW2 domain-containing protein [Pirellulales bacterium]